MTDERVWEITKRIEDGGWYQYIDGPEVRCVRVVPESVVQELRGKIERQAGNLKELHYQRNKALRDRNDEIDARTRLEGRVSELEEALAVAADDLGKAANQFASMRLSQAQGHFPEVHDNPELFEAKAQRAHDVAHRAVLAGEKGNEE